MNTQSKNSHENRSIKCSVSRCRNHCQTSDYCSLSSIQVGTHESDPSMIECTDCTSFELRS